ncbi:MAG: hypothetical protein AAFX09_05435 [Pseudomonadota bacterium]
MAILAILLPVLLGALAGLALRRQLRKLTFAGWMGWTVIGAGLPVLFGQIGALWLASEAEARLGACQAAGAPCPEAGMPVALVLSAGLSCGLAWAATAVAVRLTGR